MVNGKPGLGFKKTADRDYSLQNRRMKHVCEPVDETDVATGKYVHKVINGLIKSLQHSINKTSSDWVESFISLQNSVTELENRCIELYTNLGASIWFVDTVAKQLVKVTELSMVE